MLDISMAYLSKFNIKYIHFTDIILENRIKYYIYSDDKTNEYATWYFFSEYSNGFFYIFIQTCFYLKKL